jgi:hypothetical protein
MVLDLTRQRKHYYYKDMCFTTADWGKHDAMGICKYKWWVGLGWFVMKEGRDGMGKKKSLVHALSSSDLFAMQCIVHVTPRTAVANKTLGAKKKQKEMKGKGKRDGKAR